MKKIAIVLIASMVIVVGFLSGCETKQDGDQLNGAQGKIVFMGIVGIERSTHVINSDGSDEINFNKMLSYYNKGDDKKILLAGLDGLYTINDDGTLHLKLLWSINLSSIKTLSSSQDFEKIVVYENDSYYVSNIHIGGNYKVHIFDSDKWVGTVILSPTGEKVAFLMPVDVELKDYNLSIINSDGTGKKSIALCSENNFSPYLFGITFSPDESKITYNHKNEFHIIDVDGNNDHLIDYGPNRGTEPAWSFDSKKIAYHTNDGIYIINIDRTGKTLIKSIDTGHQTILGLCWEPNGERIAYSIQENFDSDPKIYVCNVDGGSSNFIAYGAYPKWSLN